MKISRESLSRPQHHDLHQPALGLCAIRSYLLPFRMDREALPISRLTSMMTTINLICSQNHRYFGPLPHKFNQLTQVARDAAHRAQLNQLADLLAVKATLEAQMTTKLAYLRALYSAHSKELFTVVDARIKELK